MFTRAQHRLPVGGQAFQGLLEKIQHDRVAQELEIVKEDCKRLLRRSQAGCYVEPCVGRRNPRRSDRRLVAEEAASVEGGLYLEEESLDVVVGIVQQDPDGGDPT